MSLDAQRRVVETMKENARYSGAAPSGVVCSIMINLVRIVTHITPVDLHHHDDTNHTYHCRHNTTQPMVPGSPAFDDRGG